MDSKSSIKFAAIFLLSTATSLKICNDKGGIFNGYTCVCKEGFTGEKCEVDLLNVENQVFEFPRTHLSEKLALEIDSYQRLKREAVTRNVEEEGSVGIGIEEPTEELSGIAEGSTAINEFEWFYPSCTPGSIPNSDNTSCIEVLSIAFSIKSSSSPLKIQNLGGKLQKYELLNLYESKESENSIKGVLFFQLSSNVTAKQLRKTFQEIAAATIDFGLEDLDECTFDKACPDNQVCSNVFGSFNCSCGIGFSEKKETTGQIECQSVCENHLCFNGGECVVNISGNPFCSCTSEFGGKNCGELVRPWRQATIALGTVAGFLLLCFIVLGCILICQKKRKASSSDISLVAETKPINDNKKISSPGFDESNEEVTFDNGASLTHTTTTFKPAETDSAAL